MAKPTSLKLLVSLLTLCASHDLRGADEPTKISATETMPKHYVCGKASGPVVVDGKLDDPAWEKAPWTDDFVDIEGDLKPRPRFRTRAKMLWDDQFFHVAAELSEPHVWGTITRHDAVIFQDNDFEVFIDPDGDNHEYYEFEMNALNTGWDLFLKSPYRDGGPAVNDWEIPGLLTGVHVNGTLNDPTDEDTSWTVEMAFPWKVLAEYAHKPSPPRDGDVWRVNFSRVEWKHRLADGRYEKVPGLREDNWVWSPQGVIDMHRPERWGFVQFREGVADSPFVADPTFPVRERLMRIYHGQRAYRERTKTWADSLEKLDLREVPRIDGEGPATLTTSGAEGYVVTIPVAARDGRPAATWSIRQNSKIEIR
ncbi:MAG: carbohydrate-binding family 9-like protein [Isosphaeraceae bacterium]